MQASLFPDELTPKLSFNRPVSVSKHLKLNTVKGSRKIRISSNFLPMIGFGIGSRIEPIAQNGIIEIATNPLGPQKIYSREYAKRSNNPTEAVLELTRSDLLSVIPNYTQRVHATLRDGMITIEPMKNEVFAVGQALKSLSNPLQALFALSSGIDIHSAVSQGFSIQGLIEIRPQEKRDKTILEETGTLVAVANNPIAHVFNQNIYDIDWNRVHDTMDLPCIPLLHASLQCDSFSNAQEKALREDYNTYSTRDMFIPLLDGIKRLMPAVVMIEQVANFSGSTEWALMRQQLNRLGYNVIEKVLDARDYGGLTSRQRFYCVCSLFPIDDTVFPEKQARPTAPIWDKVIVPHLSECRDVSHSKAIQEGVKVGRSRVITMDKTYSNTLLKSQLRMAKDTLTIGTEDGRYLLPSEGLMKALLSIPEEFNLEVVGQTIASEVIGQSIEYGVHDQILSGVKRHILENVGHCRLAQFSHG